MVSLSDVAEELEGDNEELVERLNGIRNGNEYDENGTEKNDPCLRLLEGHTKAVTALYFEDECLVCLLNFRFDIISEWSSVGDWSF